MSRANPRWGAPRIHGDSRKIGIAVAQSTVAKEQLDYNLLFRWFVGLGMENLVVGLGRVLRQYCRAGRLN
jgi:hypothetical protein